MRIAFPAFVAALTLLSASDAGAQQEQGSASAGTVAPAGTASAQESGTHSPNQSRPRRPSVFDVIKVVAPTLIDAATKPRPTAPVDPAAATGVSELPAADPLPETPVAVTVVPAPPAEMSRPPQAEVPVPSSTTIQPAPRPVEPAVNLPLPVAQDMPARSDPLPTIKAPPPAPALDSTQPATPAPVVKRESPDASGDAGKIPWLIFALLALAALATTSLLRMYRARQVARTRSLLSLDVRLDRSPARSPLVVRAQMMPGAAHG